ncbi:MAG: hypothetical protein ACTSX1_07965 [Candidatus Heimdallarchaeaceae archaeon]
MAKNVSDFWEILKEIQNLPNELTDNLKAIAQNEKASADNLLGAIIDQIAYNSADYQRLRNWWRDWYASHRTIGSYQMGVSDIYSMPNDQLDDLFQSFGYNFSASIRNPTDNNSPIIKGNFFLDLVNLYKIKGTPDAVLKVLQYYGLTELDIYEFDLQFEDRPLKDPNNLMFKGLISTGTSTSKSPLYLPFHLLTDRDPHWLMTESQIRTLVPLNNINFPSRSPYFAIKPIFSDRTMGVSVATLVRIVQDQFYNWKFNGVLPEDNALATVTGDQISILELYLACVKYMNASFAPIGYKGPNFLCYDGTNTDIVDILDEWDALAGKQTTRFEQKENLIEWFDTFTRATPRNFLQEITDAAFYLNEINPTFVSNLNLVGKTNIQILGSLLDDLGLWIRAELSYGFANIAYVIFGIDSLFSQLRDIVEFFKPYRARFIPIEELQFSSRLTETIIVEDALSDEGIGIEFFIHDWITGNSKPCCGDEIIDSTSVDCITTEGVTTKCGSVVVSTETPSEFLGKWNTVTSYTVNQLVSRYNPSTKFLDKFICIDDHVSNNNINQPLIGTDWQLYWETYTELGCIDTTSKGLYYTRDTYDCGSYHDIGAATDIPKELFIQQEETINDRLNCVPNEDSTAIVMWETKGVDTTSDVQFYDSTATETITEFSEYYQSGGFAIFDSGGTFDCTHSFDLVEIEVQEVIGILLTEDGDFISQEDGGSILL